MKAFTEVKIKIIRELSAGDGKRELLLEIDEEFLDIYRSETGDYSEPFDQKEFNEWLEELMKCALDEGDCKQ